MVGVLPNKPQANKGGHFLFDASYCPDHRFFWYNLIYGL